VRRARGGRARRRGGEQKAESARRRPPPPPASAVPIARPPPRRWRRCDAHAVRGRPVPGLDVAGGAGREGGRPTALPPPSSRCRLSPRRAAGGRRGRLAGPPTAPHTAAAPGLWPACCSARVCAPESRALPMARPWPSPARSRQEGAARLEAIEARRRRCFAHAPRPPHRPSHKPKNRRRQGQGHQGRQDGQEEHAHQEAPRPHVGRLPPAAHAQARAHAQIPAPEVRFFGGGEGGRECYFHASLCVLPWRARVRG
jgi:hypothetical protein